MAIIRNILVRVGADVNPLQQGMTQAQQVVNRFSGTATSSMNNVMSGTSTMVGALKGIAGVVATAFAVTKLVEFGKGAIELASNLNEVQNVVDVTFGNMSNQINTFSKTALDKFGMSELSAKKFTSTMGAMLKSSGITGDGLVKMSEGVTGLAGDMASFYNLDQETAFAKIRAGLSGETEPLKQLGVNMSVANMEAYALSQGIKTSYQNMDQAHQTLLRYNYLLSVTKDAQGDFARTSNSWANQTRLLSEQWKIFQGTMGQGFINILTPVLQGLNYLIARLQTAANYFTAFTVALFGSATPASSATDATNSAATATDKLGTSTKKTAAAIKGSLAGFDEINSLSDSATSSLADSADTVDSTGDVNLGGHVTAPDTSEIVTSLKPLKEALDNLLKPLQSIDFTPLTTALGTLKTALEPFVTTLFEGLHWAYLNVFVPLAGWTIGSLLPTFLDVLAGAFRVINPILEAFKPIALFLFNDFLKPIAVWTGGVIVSVLQELSKALNELGDWMSSHKEIVTAVLAGMAAGLATFAIATSAASIATGIWSVVCGIATAVTTALGAAIAFLASPIGLIVAAVALLVAGFVYFYNTNESFRGKVDSVLTSIKDAALNLWNNVLVPFGAFLGNVFVVAWEGLTTAATWFWKNVLAPLGDFLLWIWNSVLVPLGGILVDVLAVAFKAVSDVTEVLWKDVFVPLGEFFTATFSPAVEAVKTVFNFLWNDVLKPFGTFLENAFKASWTVIVDVLKLLWNDVLKPLATYLEEGFMNIFNTVMGSVKGLIEGSKETFIGLMDFITGTFTGNWSKAWTGIKEVFKGVFDSLVGYVKTPINMIISMINSMIDSIANIKITIPVVNIPLVGPVGGETIGFPAIGHVPMLAQGGIVDSPTLAMIGESGKEAVVPLENTSFVDKLAGSLGTAVMAAMQFGNQSNNNNNKQGDIVLQIDGVAFARVTNPYNSKETARIGASMITSS